VTGHIPLEVGGPRCACGTHGCLEAYAAGPRIAAAYAGAAGLERPVELLEVVARARAGDRAAQVAFTRAGQRLGQVLAGLVNTLNPDCIVLGGGVVVAAQDILLAPLRQQMALH